MYMHTIYIINTQLLPGHFILAESGLPLIFVNETEVYLDNTGTTIDGARVIFICSNNVQYSFEQAHTAVCNPEGLNWQPNLANLYPGMCICVNH